MTTKEAKGFVVSFFPSWKLWGLSPDRLVWGGPGVRLHRCLVEHRQGSIGFSSARASLKYRNPYFFCPHSEFPSWAHRRPPPAELRPGKSSMYLLTPKMKRPSQIERRRPFLILKGKAHGSPCIPTCQQNSRSDVLRPLNLDSQNPIGDPLLIFRWTSTGRPCHKRPLFFEKPSIEYIHIHT